MKVTEGSIANLELLNNPEEDVTVAFIQGDLYKSEKLLSLGSLYYEPLWVFHRLPEGLRQLSDLRGRKVAVGAQGSGTKALAVQMLAFNGLSESDTRMIPKGGQKAADLLQAGDVDAAILVMSHHVPVIRRLLGSKGISLMSMDRAEAYVANWRMRRKIYRWYRKLADLEPGTPADAANVSMANVLIQLDEIESQVTQLAVPMFFTKDVYNLRLHIDMLRGHFTNRASGTNGGRFDALPDNGDEGRGQSAVHTPGTPSGKHEK